MNKQEIPGIAISCYPINEYQLNCKMLMSLSDAEAFCDITASGLPLNRHLEELILKDMRKHITKSLQDIKKKRGSDV